MRPLAVIAAALALLACSGLTPPPPPPALAGQGGLYADAAIFGPARTMLERASREIDLEMYEFGRADLAALLAAAHDRGVAVRVLLDPTVPVTEATGLALKAAGVAVRWYPVDAATNQIDHVKLLVADDAALIAGMNWGATSWRNHDYGLLVGTAAGVARARDIFDQDWAIAGGLPPAAALPVLIGIAQTAPGEGIRTLIGALLATARVAVEAELFQLTDPDIEALLAAARRAGAIVRVILDPNQSLNRDAARLLAAAGIPIRWFRPPPGAKLHAKAALIDRTLVLGSANWTAHGLSINHELDVETDDAAAVAAYRSRFEADWRAAA
jgi:phosphatidylserine/phosphatidylglycerophosphate/cardiolipin synthase-like enzyme